MSLVPPIMMLILRQVVSSDTPINQPQMLINCPLCEEGFLSTKVTKINTLTHLRFTETIVRGVFYYPALGNNDPANAFVL